MLCICVETEIERTEGSFTYVGLTFVEVADWQMDIAVFFR